ncbi:hypothetical protein C3L33_03277, partial [Rhododendron williamsianum]
MEDAIVLYPSPAIGHLIAMVELGKLLLTQYPSLSVKILITTPPYDTGSTAPYINRVSAANNSITFHRLPTISLPPSVSPLRETLSFELHRLNNPHVHQALVSISETSAVRAIFMDFFCTPALSVAAELNVPAYFFMTPVLLTSLPSSTSLSSIGTPPKPGVVFNGAVEGDGHRVGEKWAEIPMGCQESSVRGPNQAILGTT